MLPAPLSPRSLIADSDHHLQPAEEAKMNKKSKFATHGQNLSLQHLKPAIVADSSRDQTVFPRINLSASSQANNSSNLRQSFSCHLSPNLSQKKNSPEISSNPK